MLNIKPDVSCRALINISMQTRRKLDRGGAINGHHSGLDSLISQVKNKHLSNSVNDEKTPMAKMFEQSK